ncbi:protein translocase subunit SecF [Parvularcula dongshanensis]|uniref:Protein-export membrane protein SecF n=1 Tax=Parvularcula dongshanensis TaxID=1173995 RepID=A0A840I769_9PROT|nr:protein translocase subunit SecF [Parvularcula dongshanensis]MBB4660352.1 preprotein translocase SecF subunit [Parvularcula dongshanensis]
MGFSFIPDDTHVPFTRFALPAQIVSLLAVIGAVAALFVFGLNFGIDFRGGVTVEVGPAEGAEFSASDLTDVRQAVGTLDLGDVRVQNIGGGLGDEQEGIVVFVEAQDGEAAAPEEGPGQDTGSVEADEAAELAQQQVADQVRGVLTETLGENISFRRVDVVGPTVSGELVRAGIEALALAIGLMLVYIWFRFEWQFSLGAVIALCHDVTLTLGVFALMQIDFTLSIIAALLTIIGYSMNDTVIVFDRIRENMRKFKRMPLPELIDLSVNQTLSRTIMTSFTTLIALFALYFFGGEVLRGFSFAIIWGILVGTYSSIFIASPILMRTGVRDLSEKRSGQTTEPVAAE